MAVAAVKRMQCCGDGVAAIQPPPSLVQAVGGDDGELLGVLHRHLLRTAGGDAVDALLRFHVISATLLLRAGPPCARIPCTFAARMARCPPQPDAWELAYCPKRVLAARLA